MAPIRLYNLASLADHAIGSSPIILRLLPPWYWAGRRAPLFTLSLSMFYVLFPFFTDQAKTCSLASGLLMHTQCHLPHYSPFSMFFSYMQKFPPALSFQVSLFFFPLLYLTTKYKSVNGWLVWECTLLKLFHFVRIIVPAMQGTPLWWLFLYDQETMLFLNDCIDRFSWSMNIRQPSTSR